MTIREAQNQLDAAREDVKRHTIRAAELREDLDRMTFDERGNVRRTPDGRPAITETEYRAARDRVKAEEDARNRARIIEEIARDNLHAATVAELLPAALAVLETYDGRQYGPTTKTKIADELETATGYRVYLDNVYSSGARLRFWTRGTIGASDLTATQWNHKQPNGTAPALDTSNKLHKTTPDQWTTDGPREIVEDPDQRAADILAALAALDAAEKAYNDAQQAYNRIIPSRGNKAPATYGAPARAVEY